MIPFADITFEEKLGQGAFGMVFKGTKSFELMEFIA